MNDCSIPTKICSRCGWSKLATTENFYKHPKCKFGLAPTCKACSNEIVKLSDAKRKAKDPERHAALANARSMKYYKNNLEKARAKNRESAARARKDPEKYAKIQMRKRAGGAGLTVAQFNDMLKSQNNKCAICEIDDPNVKGTTGWNVDHCHKSGKVRFILCNACNRGLAAFRDNPEFMRKAAELLEAIEIKNDTIVTDNTTD